MKEVPKRQTTIKELQASESLESKGAPYETFEEFCISQSHMRGSYLCHNIIHFNFLFGQNCLRIQTLLHKILHKLLCNIFHVTVCSSWFYLFTYLFICCLFCYLNTLSSIRAIKKIFTQVVIDLALFS